MTAPRILHLLAGQPQGGAEAFALRLILALAARGVPQALITRPDTPRLDELRAAGVVVRTARFATPLFDFPTHGIIKKTFKTFAPNIVLSYMNRANAFSKSLKNRRAKLVGRLGGYYDLKYYNAADYLIGNTEDLVKYFTREGWPAERSIYLPNFAEEKNSPPASRAELNTPANVPLFFALGRFHENKAFDVLLNATAQVPNAYLWLAGDGDSRAALEAQAAQLGIADRVKFLGWRADTAALYAAADVFICPSRHEPLGNVMLEAMAHGKPIIATRTAGAQQLLRDSASAILTDIDDANALAAAMKHLIANPMHGKVLGQAAQNDYQQIYSVDKICDRYMAFFQKIVATLPDVAEEK